MSGLVNRPRPGCCVDGSCRPNLVGSTEEESDCMRLPMGVYCGDCVHIRKCSAIYGKTPRSDTCDFFPRKFRRPMP